MTNEGVDIAFQLSLPRRRESSSYQHLLCDQNQFFRSAQAFSQLTFIGGFNILRSRGILIEGRNADDVAERYLGGFYAKMYLSPLDLHYVIFPCNGEVVGSLHSPGSALPVIFYRSADIKNERLTTEYKTRFGFNMLIAMIGSFAVNAIERNYQVGESYSQGDILGRFLIGSTVLLIFPPDSAEMLIKVGKKVKLYQPLIKPI